MYLRTELLRVSLQLLQDREDLRFIDVPTESFIDFGSNMLAWVCGNYVCAQGMACAVWSVPGVTKRRSEMAHGFYV